LSEHIIACRDADRAIDRNLTALQPRGIERECGSAGGGFISITASNRNDKTSILRTIDCNRRVCAKERSHGDIAHFDQARAIGTCELCAGIPLCGHIIQTDSNQRGLTYIDGCRADNHRCRRLRLEDFTKCKDIKTAARLGLNLDRITPGALGTG
jgi:hypothetical protein